MKSAFAILGTGNVGTAFAQVLAHHRKPVRMWCIEPDVTEAITKQHENTKYLPGITLPKNITATDDIERVLHDADTVIIAVPSFALEGTFKKARPFFAKNAIIGSLTKGLDPTTGLPLALAMKPLLPPAIRLRLCLIAGPAVANEIAQGTPSVVMIASEHRTARTELATSLEQGSLKAACTADALGAGYAMAFKNVYAIALGMCDGLKYSTNTKALVTTFAIHEMSQLLAKLGAAPDTAMSYAGLGDLIVTGFSPHGRNRTYGERLVGATSKEPADLGLGTVEGIAAARIATETLKNAIAHAPLFQAVVACLSRRSNFEKPFVDFLKAVKLSGKK